MLEQCLCHRLKGEEIVCEWFAFSATKKQIPLTLDNLEQFEHEVSTTSTKEILVSGVIMDSLSTFFT